ncbi:uncharacterized protein LOC143941218 isoform X2 [Lithobates pipiens]
MSFQEKSLGKARPGQRKCPSCKTPLRDSWQKAMCRNCIRELMEEETSQQYKDLFSSVKELTNSLSSVRSILVQNPPAQTEPQNLPPSPRASSSRQVETEESGDEGGSTLISFRDSEEEEEEEDSRGSKFKLSLEEVDDILKAIYTTLKIQEEKVQLSVHDKMYQGLDETKRRVFPVHRVLSDSVRKEWKDPEKAPFFSKALKRRFPFEDKDSEVWNKKPRVDAAFSQVSRRTDLAFEDMGILKDPMDKKADSILKAWDAASVSLKPAMAATVVARNLECWVEKLKSHIEAGTPRKDLLESFPLILNAVKYMADASAESVKLAARSSALVNSARRAVWLKTWSGDTASKVKLCGLPFSGDLLFGPDLESVLDRTADKKKAFPVKKKQIAKKNFRAFQQSHKKDQEHKSRWGSQKGKGRGGVLFRSPPEQSPKNK